MKRITLLLVVIALLFLFTRLFRIDTNPPSLYWDEASIGYNAYSVTVDGKDEWGEFLPLHFRAFGEFKLPVYIYSVSLVSYLLGLTVLAVRLPAVLFGLGGVVVTYSLSYEITRKKCIGLLSSFILAFTPWLFIFTRAGYEATAGLFFYLLGILLFLLGEKKRFLIPFSFISFVLSMYSYNSFRVISVLTIFVLLAYLFAVTKNVKKHLGPLIVGFGILLLSLVPMYKLYTKDTGGARLQQVALQGNTAEKTTTFITNYISHFSFDFLFFQGDTNPRSQMPGYGQVFIVTLPLLLAGLYVIVKAKEKRLWLVVIFLLISVIPASLTSESPHALRSIAAAPFISTISAMGVYFFYLVSKKKPAITVFFVSLYLIFFLSYFREFNNNYAQKYSHDWQYGYYHLFTNESFRNETSYTYVSDEYGQPYIFNAFYNKIPPEMARRMNIYNPPDMWGFSVVSRWGQEVNYRVDLLDEPCNGCIVYMAGNDVLNLPGEEIGTIKFLDGKDAFTIYRTYHE